MPELEPPGAGPGAVGVIVPVRGASPFLDEALDAILAQEPSDTVVVDDASEEPVTLPAAAARHCRLVRRAARGGPAGARQTGLEALSTDLVALCDADDVWEPGKLAVQLAALDANPGAVLCFGRATVVGPDGTPTGERWAEPAPGPRGRDDLLPSMYERDLVPTSSVVLRRDALRAAGGFASQTPYMAEDWDLWLRLLAGGATFVCEPAARVRYRRHAEGLTADLVQLARGSRQIHERHAGLVSAEARESAIGRDCITLARGEVRRRDYRSARAALRKAATHTRLEPRERVLRMLLTVPGVRAALGRRGPYSPGAQ